MMMRLGYLVVTLLVPLALILAAGCDCAERSSSEDYWKKRCVPIAGKVTVKVNDIPLANGIVKFVSTRTIEVPRTGTGIIKDGKLVEAWTFATMMEFGIAFSTYKVIVIPTSPTVPKPGVPGAAAAPTVWQPGAVRQGKILIEVTKDGVDKTEWNISIPGYEPSAE